MMEESKGSMGDEDEDMSYNKRNNQNPNNIPALQTQITSTKQTQNHKQNQPQKQQQQSIHHCLHAAKHELSATFFRHLDQGSAEIRKPLKLVV